MDGYSEIGAIYFSVAKTTSYARFVEGKITTGSYEGAPPYQEINGKAPMLLRQYHSAEHQVYKSFMARAKKLPGDSSLKDLSNCIPSIDEAEATSPFSFFCGTTVFLMCGLILVLSAIPNLLHFHNTDLFFMLFWMIGTLVLSSLICMWIQERYFLAKPDKQHLRLALEALKEVFRHGATTS